MENALLLILILRYIIIHSFIFALACLGFIISSRREIITVPPSWYAWHVSNMCKEMSSLLLFILFLDGV
jgi:hypothetical protein